MAERAIPVDAGGRPAAPVATARVRNQRWAVFRRALTARGAPFGGAVLIGAVLLAIFAPLLAPYDPLKQDLSNVLLPPSAQHLLGTDNNGRDVLARMIFGARVSLIAGLASVSVAVIAGSLLGLGAGFAGGRA